MNESGEQLDKDLLTVKVMFGGERGEVKVVGGRCCCLRFSSVTRQIQLAMQTSNKTTTTRNFEVRRKETGCL